MYLRKGFAGMFVISLMVAVLTACSNSQAEREVYETAIDEMMEAAGVPHIFSEDSDNPTVNESEQGAVDIDLGLSITALSRTAHFPNLGINTHITTDGLLQRQSGTTRTDDGDWVREWETIDTDVRTFLPATLSHINTNARAIFYIKNNNSLWAFGSNANGLLGDGTGVDRDEPVHIMDNVADIAESFNGMVIALQTNGTLWRWGAGVFSPEHEKDDVVNLSSRDGLVRVQTRNGQFYLHRQLAGQSPAYHPIEPWLGAAFDTLRFSTDLVRWSTAYINHERTLVFNDVEIAENVERLIVADDSGTTMFFIKSDGSLWGMGQNARGNLGDGTKVPRNTPVHVADNVVDAGLFKFLTADGLLFTWDENNPVPQPTFENVAAFADRHIHFRDGSVWFDAGGVGALSGEQIIENVLIPSIRTFD